VDAFENQAESVVVEIGGELGGVGAVSGVSGVSGNVVGHGPNGFLLPDSFIFIK
jgi:hypothetical protein